MLFVNAIPYGEGFVVDIGLIPVSEKCVLELNLLFPTEAYGMIDEGAIGMWFGNMYIRNVTITASRLTFVSARIILHDVVGARTVAPAPGSIFVHYGVTAADTFNETSVANGVIMHFITCEQYGVGQIFDIGPIPACNLIDVWVNGFFPRGTASIDPMVVNHWLSPYIFVRSVHEAEHGTFVSFRLRLTDVKETKTIYGDEDALFFKYSVQDTDIFFLDDVKSGVFIKSIMQ